MIFVYGPLDLRGRTRLTIVNGALLVKGDLTLGEGVSLDVRHGPAARGLPGLVASAVETAQAGTIEIERGAMATVDGLVFAEDNVEVLGGALEALGAVVAKRVVNSHGTAIIRHDSRVLATQGLGGVAAGLTEILSWREAP